MFKHFVLLLIFTLFCSVLSRSNTIRSFSFEQRQQHSQHHQRKISVTSDFDTVFSSLFELIDLTLSNHPDYSEGQVYRSVMLGQMSNDNLYNDLFPIVYKLITKQY